MEIVIVTGMSGAGKSTVLRHFEDLGYYCVDNIPPTLISKFAEICFRTGSDIEKVALGIDTRGGKLFNDLFEGLDELKSQNYDYKILFLDSSDEILQKRFSETRRSHPLNKDDRIISCILKEREILKEVKSKSDYIIDTSHILSRQLKEKVADIFVNNEKFESLMITILSFGFKYGVPPDIDLLFDVRFIPNPFYISELKEQTGLDKPVKDYVMDYDITKNFLNKLEDMVCFLIPNYLEEGKTRLVIGIACTGGKHRSVAIASELHKTLQNEGYSVIINHRDIKN